MSESTTSRARRAVLATVPLVAAVLLALAAAPALAQEASSEPPPAPGPGFPSPQAIAAALLAGLGEALTGWLRGPDLRGAIGAAAGELLEWGLRRVWDGLAWAFGGANVFTQLPPAWTTELPAVRLARERLTPVATGLVGLGVAASVLLAGLGTIVGRPFGWLWGASGRSCWPPPGWQWRPGSSPGTSSSATPSPAPCWTPSRGSPAWSG